MADQAVRYETDHKLLGREGFSFPNKRRDPFSGVMTNSTATATSASVFEAACVADDIRRLIDEVDLYPLPPFLDPEHILMVPPVEDPTPPGGVTIYWTDSRGRCRRGLEIIG